MDVEASRREFESIFERHKRDVFAYVLRRIGRESAEDVVAETFLVAWRRFADLPEEPLPWLLGVARKVAANHRRAGTRQQEIARRLASTLGGGAPAGPGARVPGAVAAALARLSEQDREALLLDAWEDLDHRQAATVLACSPVAYRLRLHRARKRLRRELELIGEDEGVRHRRVPEAPSTAAEEL